MAGVANAIAALFGDRVGAIAMQHAGIKVVLICQMLHAGNKRLIK
jgi:hypothetical protein